MKKSELKKGDVVQLNPVEVRTKAFAGCFMIVTEPKIGGAQGYIQGIGDTKEEIGHRFFYRAKWNEMELIGTTVWTLES